MTLREKVKQFISISQMPTTKFCKNVQVSQTMLYCYLNNEREISSATENRIIDFMTDYVKKLMELAR
jgi:hypothetical protein